MQLSEAGTAGGFINGVTLANTTETFTTCNNKIPSSSSMNNERNEY